MSFFKPIIDATKKMVQKQDEISKGNDTNIESRNLLQSKQRSNIDNKKNKYAEENSTPKSQKNVPFCINYKATNEVKLAVLFLENTNQLSNNKDTIIEFVRILTEYSDYITVIQYGQKVRKKEVSRLKNFDFGVLDNFCNREDLGDSKCLFDAIVELEDFITGIQNEVIEESINMEDKITKIDVIGIGSCSDNCSIASEDTAMETMKKISQIEGVVTKYLCYKEEYFPQAASIGFHSIASISRSYQEL